MFASHFLSSEVQDEINVRVNGPIAAYGKGKNRAALAVFIDFTLLRASLVCCVLCSTEKGPFYFFSSLPPKAPKGGIG